MIPIRETPSQAHLDGKPMSALGSPLQKEIAEISWAIASDAPSQFRRSIDVRPGGEDAGAATVEVRLGQGVRWMETGEQTEMLVDVANAVQDFISDELHAPWPELIDQKKRSLGVLEPHVRHGRAVWANELFCSSIGSLKEAVAEAGLELR